MPKNPFDTAPEQGEYLSDLRESAAATTLAAQPEGGDYEDLVGGGGWTYRVFADGRLKVLRAPRAFTQFVGKPVGARHVAAVKEELAQMNPQSRLLGTAPRTEDATVPDTRESASDYEPGESPSSRDETATVPDIRESDPLGESASDYEPGESPSSRDETATVPDIRESDPLGESPVDEEEEEEDLTSVRSPALERWMREKGYKS